MAETLNDEIDAPENGESRDETDLNFSDVVNEGNTKSDAASGTTEAENTDGETEALSQLEAEELEMLTEDEEAESLPVDEAEELRQIRHAAMSLESAADTAGADEFVCSSCFLVKAGSQLAYKRKKLCRDCA